MFCPKCGNEIVGHGSFCPKCGTPFNAKPATAQTAPSNPVSGNTVSGNTVAASPLISMMQAGSLDKRLPAARIACSVVAAATLLLPWLEAAYLTGGSKTGNFIDAMGIALYNIVGENVSTPLYIMMIATFIIGLLLMIIGSIVSFKTNNKTARTVAAVGCIIVALFALLIINNGNIFHEGSLVSYAVQTDVTMMPWICMIASICAGATCFLEK